MNIIILSGGSGKRLWPLSNDIRSKQFLPLFRSRDGGYESMVQRVYAQITEAIPDAQITIATGKSQVSAIRNQLGDRAWICVEPERRDTFPAIALAAEYLKAERGAGDAEGVVVCPVDPYVERSYYETVGRLARLAEESDAANLYLMGIEPTYPSEKYGYVIPETAEEVSRVSEFREKPDQKTAEEYLRRGALWNAGVFAFRLGYLLGKARELLRCDGYAQLREHYGACEKISFDYAVAEREPEIRVMRYRGDWKDVGTWNMMAEAMSDPVKGNAIVDETCENTNVVNELDLPVLCMGCKDLIVAASSDGILVADKERSSHMKPYVERIDQEAHYAEKSWGTYTVIDVHPGFMTIKVFLRAGNRMKVHSHERRDEVWTVVKGAGRAMVDGGERKVSPGDVISVRAGQKHTLIADSDLYVIEVQVGEDIRKDDKTVWRWDDAGGKYVQV